MKRLAELIDRLEELVDRIEQTSWPVLIAGSMIVGVVIGGAGGLFAIVVGWLWEATTGRVTDRPVSVMAGIVVVIAVLVAVYATFRKGDDR